MAKGSYEQQQINQLFAIIAASKLISELTEQTSLTTTDYAAINSGTSDAMKIAIPLLRGILGAYDATANDPTLSDLTGIEGDSYLVDTAGTQDFGSGNLVMQVNDVIQFREGQWRIIFRDFSTVISPNKFVGGITIQDGTYSYDVYQQYSIINNTIYDNYVADVVTLSASDGTYDRFDIIVFNNDDTFSVIEGTPAANPQIENVDDETQVVVRIVRVTATSTTESGPTQYLAYDENVEWTSADSGAAVDPDSTEQASNGSKSTKFTTAATSDYVTYTDAGSHDGSLVTQVKFKVYLPSSNNYKMSIYLGTSGAATLLNGRYGLDTSLLGIWQQIIIPASEFSNLNTITYDNFKLQNAKANSTFYIDEVYIVEGFVGGGTASDYTIAQNSANIELYKDGVLHSYFTLALDCGTI